jgi:hypothetical protein
VWLIGGSSVAGEVSAFVTGFSAIGEAPLRSFIDMHAGSL